jgi:hypothetical protein
MNPTEHINHQPDSFDCEAFPLLTMATAAILPVSDRLTGMYCSCMNHCEKVRTNDKERQQ